MSFWGRSGSVQVGPYQYSLDTLVYDFEVPFQDNEELAVAKINLYNLAESTRASIQKKQPVILNAGYQGDVGSIFAGAIAECQHSHKKTDWTTTIKATAAMEEWLSKIVNKTYMPGIDAESVLRDLLNIFGIEVSQLQLARNKTYSRGKVCNGPVRQVLTEIITSDCKSNLLIWQNQVFIKDPNITSDSGILLTPRTGLLPDTGTKDSTNITTAQDTEKTDAEKAEEVPTIKRKCLLNHRIMPGVGIRLEDKTTQGYFRVKSGTHKGSRKREHVTEMELIPI